MPLLSKVTVRIDELGVAYGFLLACAANAATRLF